MATYSPWQRRFPPARCDVAVVGGGVIGAATAYALGQQAPDLRVVLLEAESLASGASGRNAGFLIPGPPSDYLTATTRYGEALVRRVLEFTLENIDQIGRLDGASFDLDLCGCLIAAGSDDEADRLARAAELLGSGAHFLGSEEVAGRSGGQGFSGGLELHAGGMLDPVRLVRYLAAQSGAAVLEQWPVTRLDAEGGVVSLGGPAGFLEAGRVVLCLNAYLPRLVDGAEQWVRPVRAQMLATAPLAPFLRLPVYSHDGFYYVRQTSDGRVLLGGARHLCEKDETGFEAVTTPSVQVALEAYLRKHFPATGPITIERRWSGIMGFSPDGLPVAGGVAGLPHVFAAAGFTGHGMAYAVRFGQVLARLATGQHDDAAELFAFDRLSR